jgi:hypothetical protein
MNALLNVFRCGNWGFNPEWVGDAPQPNDPPIPWNWIQNAPMSAAWATDYKEPWLDPNYKPDWAKPEDKK